MKTFLGVLLIIVGILCIPAVISPSVCATIGGIIGVALFTFLPGILLIRSGSKKEE
jgi:hypothetical protein